MEELIYVQLKTLEDMVKLISMAPGPYLQYAVSQGRHIYFIQILQLTGKPFIYFYEPEEALKDKYVVYNRFQDAVTFSDKPGSDGQAIYIPILEVKKTNVLDKLA